MSKITYINKSSCIIKNVKFKGSAVIGPNVILCDCEIGENSKIVCSKVCQSQIGDNTSVQSSQIEDSTIGNNCEIGPYSHIRPASQISDRCKIGNFVEIKKSKIGEGCKISHLSYVGDATLGKNVNVGCGVIFANFDGQNKHRTNVGDNVFIGSNCNLIAPLEIGKNAFVAAGSTVTKNLSDGQFCIARERETIRDGFDNLYVKKFENEQAHFFGTDGIRFDGTKEEFFDIGKKFGEAISQKKQTIVLGRDTRPSGKIIREGILEGLTNAQIFDLGVTSTPCVAFMTKTLGADLGIVLTASHNPANFNGIKVFGKNGQKLCEAQEKELEQKMQKIDKKYDNFNKFSNKQSKKQKITKISAQKYISHLTRQATPMHGLEIAVDVSGGASEKLAKSVFEKLGVQAHIIGSSKHHKINDGCGCLNLENLKQYMKKNNVPIGFAFDGDGDRVLAIDEKLQIVDGDKFLFMLAKQQKAQNKLKNNHIVATVMSNLALIQQLKKQGISTSITPVGDKHVIEEMNHLGASLGGEQSGHIITKDVCGSGDGLLLAIEICKLVFSSKKTLHELSRLKLFPQFQSSHKTSRAKEILASDKLMSAVLKYEKYLGEDGRILIRKSGTEPKIRLLVESKNKHKAKKVFSSLDKMICSMC